MGQPMCLTNRMPEKQKNTRCKGGNKARRRRRRKSKKERRKKEERVEGQARDTGLQRAFDLGRKTSPVTFMFPWCGGSEGHREPEREEK